MTLDEIFNEVRLELVRARDKFPTNKRLVLAFAEESGEFIKAIMDHELDKASRREVRAEGVQAIAMVCRVLAEGDADFRYDPL